MSEWYCPNCGISDSKGDYRDDMFICAGCDRQQFKRTPPAFVTAMQDQIKNLQSVAIKAAFYFYLPHSDDAYDEVLEALDAAGYKRPDEDGYLGGVK